MVVIIKNLANITFVKYYIFRAFPENLKQLSLLVYYWKESCLLIGLICFHKSLCLAENWFKPIHKLILHDNQLELVSRS